MMEELPSLQTCMVCRESVLAPAPEEGGEAGFICSPACLGKYVEDGGRRDRIRVVARLGCCYPSSRLVLPDLEDLL